jgi:hypothetical protein
VRLPRGPPGLRRARWPSGTAGVARAAENGRPARLAPLPTGAPWSTVPAMATTAVALADELGVDEGDVEVLLQQLGEHEHRLPAELATFIRAVFDPEGERTGLRSADDADGPKPVVAPPPALHDPIPVNFEVPGCPAMVRRGAGQ